MTLAILYQVNTIVLSLLLFAGIIVFYFAGLRIFQYRKNRTPAYEPKGIGPFEGAMLGLISLLLAFTFNQSASNYELRRKALVNETHCIGTALLRSDLYADSIRQEFRKDFKEYIMERIHYFEVGDDEKEISVSLKKATLISDRIWNRASKIAQRNEVVIKSMQMIPAINDMMDALGEREETRNTHIPESIVWLLLFLCLMGSFIVGYASKSKKPDWIILLCYSMITVMTVHLILDLDQPRHGLIDTNRTHQGMDELLNSFEETSK